MKSFTFCIFVSGDWKIAKHKKEIMNNKPALQGLLARLAGVGAMTLLKTGTTNY